MSKTTAVITGLVRPLLEAQLPDWIEAHWFFTEAEGTALAPIAEIGWFDMMDREAMARVIAAATGLKWLNSIYAGLDGMPLAALRARGTIVTHGAGINAVTIAEYVVMAMLTVAKGYAEVVRAGDRREWLVDSPGKRELAGSRALLLGYGAIGRLIQPRLAALEVGVTVVRRTPGPEGGPEALTPDQWRARLGEFDWVILAVPATPATDGMIGAAELAAMKPDAVLINIARGSVVDQDALLAALTARTIGGAFLDVTTPEPLPADHPLWAAPGAHISMHLSGRAQDQMVVRSVARFAGNLARWQRGEPVAPQFDLTLGY